MSRDPSRNAYHTVGFPRDSATYQQLIQEAAESNLNVPSLIALRVADWYRLIASGVLPVVAQSPNAPGRKTAPVREKRAGNEVQARANAEAAAEAWLD